LFIAPVNTRKTGLKSGISTLVNKSGKWEGLNQWHRLNVFFQFTVPFRTCSESVVIILRPLIIDSSEPGLFPIGER